MILQKESELVRLGLVGCGSWGPRYCRSVAKLKNVQLFGVTDIVQERAVEFPKKLLAARSLRV
jgi:predicted dehydrogenase